jgi:hypothetical protein
MLFLYKVHCMKLSRGGGIVCENNPGQISNSFFFVLFLILFFVSLHLLLFFFSLLKIKIKYYLDTYRYINVNVFCYKNTSTLAYIKQFKNFFFVFMTNKINMAPKRVW